MKLYWITVTLRKEDTTLRHSYDDLG